MAKRIENQAETMQTPVNAIEKRVDEALQRRWHCCQALCASARRT